MSAEYYLDPQTGELSTSPPFPGARPLPASSVSPGIRAPLVLRCSVHQQHEAVDTITSAETIDPGCAAAAGLVHAALAAACPTCREWRAATGAFHRALKALRAQHARQGIRLDTRLALPARSYLIIGRALNAPLPLPEALSALADLALPCDPPPVPLDAAPCLRPDGAVIFRRHGERIPDGESRLPADRNWCLMRCADHGWEFVGTLPPPSAKTLAIARELGHTLIAQGSESCEVYAMHKRVMDAELEAAAPATAWRGQPVPPLEFLRSYRAIAGALRRTTTDIGYVVARALEQMAAQDW